jgi:hypothetical protein
VIEIRVTGTDAELDVIALALTGVLADVVEASQRYPGRGGDPRVRAYLRAAAVLPELLPAPIEAAPLASSPAGSSPAGEWPAPTLSPEDTADVSDPFAMIDAARRKSYEHERYEVPTFAGDPPAPRQRWNAELGRHAWWHPCEHWYACLHCGVHKHKLPASGGRWYDEWGYPAWPAVEWGTTRGGEPFPRCPGPGQIVSRHG